MIPKDPVMLLSFMNLKLRDFYTSFEALCEDLDIDKTEIEEKLKSIGYVYDNQRNQKQNLTCQRNHNPQFCFSYRSEKSR